VFSGPFLVVVASLATLALAISSDDGLVADDYYKQGLGINREIGSVEAARVSGVTAAIQFNEARDRVRVLLTTGDARPDVLRLALVHPTRGGADQRITLARQPNGTYSGRLASPHAGRWHLALLDDQDGWRLAGDWRTDRAAVTLGASER
jgi:hypothetical protein